MPTYYMTSTAITHWHPCKAETLTAAKREASREFGAGYIDSVIMVGEGDGIEQERRVVASRSAQINAKWLEGDAAKYGRRI